MSTDKLIRERLQALQNIAVEMMQPRELHDALKLIVERSVDLLVADGGSLYLKDSQSDFLVFEVAINHSISFPFEKKSIPISDRGLANYCFQTGTLIKIDDVKQIPADAPYLFDSLLDEQSSYQTRSAIVIPLISSKGKTLGVLQIINRKSFRDQVWPSNDESLVAQMPVFSTEDVSLLQGFAGIASSSLESSFLHDEIEALFEGFVRASVHAIEARDPTTRGHSERVAALTVELAESVSRCGDRDVKHIDYNRDEIAEIRYASLLHDFGKIGVREATLLKEEKLSPRQKFEIRSRLNEFKHVAEISVLREYLEKLIKENRAPSPMEFARIEKDIAAFGLKLEDVWLLVEELNRPSVLSEDRSQKLTSLSHMHCKDCEGNLKPVLQQDEIFSLNISRGSLTFEERLEIESHVVHTVEFLKKIPWTQKFANVPKIAGGHHERLDGTGYPEAAGASSIPDQARMMAICDIFDALAANDRPYKPAVPLDKALDILEEQVKSGGLDKRFFRIFTEAKIWETPGFVLNADPALKKLAA